MTKLQSGAKALSWKTRPWFSLIDQGLSSTQKRIPKKLVELGIDHGRMAFKTLMLFFLSFEEGEL